MPPAAEYRGRFAPSPTGPLHFGSLVAALGSWLRARSRGGRWLVRIEDIDPPREVPGAADEILRALEAMGLHWDGPVWYQSRRMEAYRQAWEALQGAGHAYPCGCSRKEIQAAGLRGPEGYLYPGTCRNGLAPGRAPRALRLRVDGVRVRVRDALHGAQEVRLQAQCGDFVIRRADGLPAYHLAVVVDDAAQGITEVVRGADLLFCTARQRHLQALLGLPAPGYLHLPVAVNARGEKLSKQTGAPPLDLGAPGRELWRALAFLGQGPPPELAGAPPGTLLEWALARWDWRAVPATPPPAGAGGGQGDSG